MRRVTWGPATNSIRRAESPALLPSVQATLGFMRFAARSGRGRYRVVHPPATPPDAAHQNLQ